jgi:hypothetical protein
MKLRAVCIGRTAATSVDFHISSKVGHAAAALFSFVSRESTFKNSSSLRRDIRENLRKFQDTFSMLSDQEKPECLSLILKDVILGKETVQLSIFDLPEFNYLGSSKNHTERLLR